MSGIPSSFGPLSNDSVGQLFVVCDLKTARKLGAVNKQTRKIFCSDDWQRILIPIYFKCSVSPAWVRPRELYLRLSNPRKLACPICVHTFPSRGEVRCLKMSADGAKALEGTQTYSDDNENNLKLVDLTKKTCTALSGHEFGVHCVQMNAKATKALSGSYDKTLKLWDLTSGACIRTFTGHENSIYCLQMNEAETVALSGSYDKTLKLWDLTSGACIHTLCGHKAQVNCLQMSKAGTKALSGSDDMTLRLWDLESGKLIDILVSHEAPVKLLQMSTDGRKAVSVSGGQERAAKAWDLTTGKCLKTVSILGEPIFLHMNPDPFGTTVIIGTDLGTIIYWDLTTEATHRVGDGHTCATSMQISADGNRIVSGSLHKTLKVFDVAASRHTYPIEGHENGIKCTEMTDDGKGVLTGSLGALKLWDLESLPDDAPPLDPFPTDSTT